MRNNFNKGFTLVELLAVVAILATIVTATVVTINPIEMLQQAEDAVRLNDINSIHQVLTLFRSQRPGGSIGEPNIVYVSIPSASSTCVGAGLPALPTGWEYRCVTAANLRNIDGSGWIPVNFASIPGRIPFTILPIDPVNTAASGSYYIYVTNGTSWALATMIGSRRHASFAVRDGGTDFGRFEVGTNLSLWTTASGLVGYWNFDGAGSIAHNQTAGLEDMSGRANHGVASNANATSMAFVPERVDTAISFDGVDDFVRVSHTEIQNIVFGTSTVFTLEAWAFPRAWANWAAIVNKARGACWGHTTNGMWAETGGFVCAMGSGVAPAECNPTGSSVHIWHRPPLDTWNHIVCTANGTNLIMHVNGREVGRVLIAGLTHPRTANTEPLVVGRRTESAGPSFNGNIDEVRIYNRALSAAEIMANFNATR